MTDTAWSRRRLVQATALAGAALLVPAGAARGEAAGCPATAGRTVRWIVPYSPGGGYDLLSRLLEPFVEARLGAEIAVTNISGAGGLVGTKALRNAAPDGLTLGILNAPGVLAATLIGEPDVPEFGEDLTVLGRVARNQHVWATAGGSPHRTIDDLLAAAGGRPAVFAVSEVGGTPFLSASIVADLLGMEAEFVAGYPGSRELVLSLLRGETDVASLQFDSIVNQVEAGELRPLLQISQEPISAHPALADVPVLGGAEGVTVRQARQLGQDTSEAEAHAAALVAFIGAGRLIAAPGGLTPGLAECLAGAVEGAMADPGFAEAAAAAKQTIEPASAAEARATLVEAARGLDLFAPILAESLRRIRS